MAERRQVGNLIKPRPIPAFTAATTATARWIDGTAGGSATDLGYGWYTIIGVGNMAFSITEEGLTIAATTATGRGRVMTAPFEATTTKQNINNYGIPVKANTSYTFSYKAKGTNVMASTTRAGVILFATGGATVATPVPNHIPEGDSDWTDYSVTFTTGATVAYAVIYPGVFTAGNIMSATFKDFKLDTTTPTTRTTATSRTTASNRVAVRDMGTALSFDGSSVVTVPHNTIFNPSAITLSAWVHRTGFDSSDASGIMAKIGNYIFRVEKSTGRLQLICNSFVNQINGIIEANKYYFVCATNDGVTSKLYINGVLNNSSASTLATASVSDLLLGQQDGSRAWVGIIDEPRIWNRALTADEIKNLYLYGAVPQDGLVAEYLFDEATGTTAIDTSGNGNDGVISGCTYTTDTPLRPRSST